MDSFITPVSDPNGEDDRRNGVFSTSGLAYRPGPLGAERLRKAGIALQYCADDPAPWARTGLVLASQ